MPKRTWRGFISWTYRRLYLASGRSFENGAGLDAQERFALKHIRLVVRLMSP
jgi:hypothetical protein